jgi:hypothetical protein
MFKCTQQSVTLLIRIGGRIKVKAISKHTGQVTKHQNSLRLLADNHAFESDFYSCISLLAY